MNWRRRACLPLLALALAASTACTPPPRGALYQRFLASPTATAAPSGASLAQYYTLGAFRVGDQLASASNALDDGLIDRQQGLISAAYLTLVAQRSDQAASEAVADAAQLSPPPEIRSQATAFYTAAVALANAVSATRQALAAPAALTTSQLLTATTQRRAAAHALEAGMSALEAASWQQPAAGQAP